MNFTSQTDPSAAATAGRKTVRPVHLTRGLFGRIGLLVVSLAVVQFTATIFLYDHISRDSVREDHARRVAELLEVSQRLYERDEDELAEIMSTQHLQVWLDDRPAVRISTPGVATLIRDRVKTWEPTLAGAVLNMDVEKRVRHEHLVGSMQLPDGEWLNFRSINLSRPWLILFSASLITLLLTALCIAFAAFALQQLGMPLRRLTDAANRIGEGPRVVLEEEGTPDLRDLSRAFNAMQDRIDQILSDQTAALVGMSHDLRTPLSRLRLSSDFIDQEDIKALVASNVDEMDALVLSLQTFLNAQEIRDVAQPVSLLEIVAHAGAAWAGNVVIAPGTEDIRIVSYPVVLRRALTPLLENAVQYGGRATVSLVDEGGPVIHINDAGPGIADEQMERLTEPFFRGDEARARNTGGFGLGIPTAQRLLQRHGGSLSFARSEQGGLDAIVRVPSV